MAEELSANKERPTEACGGKASTDNICTIAGISWSVTKQRSKIRAVAGRSDHRGATDPVKELSRHSVYG